MELIHNRCEFLDKQNVRIQETPDNMPEGEVRWCPSRHFDMAWAGSRDPRKAAVHFHFSSVCVGTFSFEGGGVNDPSKIDVRLS